MTTSSDLRGDLENYLKASRPPTIPQLGGWFRSSISKLKPATTKESLEEVEESAALDPWFPSLSKRQRLTGFLGCFIAGVFCLVLAGCYVPVLLLRSRKFAILFTFGSVFILVSFSILRGPYKHFRGMFTADRLPFTTIYVLSIASTLYFALALSSTLLTVLAGSIQICALVWYTVSYIPGGQSGLWVFSKMATSVVKKGATTTFSA